MASKRVIVPHLALHNESACTPGWISQGFATYKAKNADALAEAPDTPTFLDLSRTFRDEASGKTFPLYRLVATTAPAEMWKDKTAFLEMLNHQKEKGHPKLIPYNQIWAIRDHSTGAIYICTPDVFTTLGDTTSKSAKNKEIHIFRVFPTWMAMEILAKMRREILKGGSGAKLQTSPEIIAELTARAKAPTGEIIDYIEEKRKDGKVIETIKHRVVNFSMRVGEHVYMPICPTSLLHDIVPDLVNPTPKKSKAGKAKTSDESETSKAPAAKRARAASSRPASSSAVDDDEIISEEVSEKKDEKISRAKRGRELSAVGDIIDDGEVDTETDEQHEDESVPEDDTSLALRRAVRALMDVVPTEETTTFVELHRAVAVQMADVLPQICADAERTLCDRLKVPSYDNSDLVVIEEDNELSELRRSAINRIVTGDVSKRRVPAWMWPLLLHCTQDQDPDIYSFIDKSATAISGASSDWGKETMRPMTCDEVPNEWSGLLKGKMLEQAIVLTQYERAVMNSLRGYVDTMANAAMNFIVSHDEMKARHAEIEGKLETANAEIERLSAELTAAKAAAEKPKLPALPPPPPPKKVRSNAF